MDISNHTKKSLFVIFPRKKDKRKKECQRAAATNRNKEMQTNKQKRKIKQTLTANISELGYFFFFFVKSQTDQSFPLIGAVLPIDIIRLGNDRVLSIQLPIHKKTK